MIANSNKFKIKDYIIFSIIIGIIATFWNYSYGFSNTVETIPKIMRALDSSYLINDFTVNESTSGVGPRYFFTQFLLLLKNILTIPLIYFILTLLTNISISVITFMFAINIFNSSKSASILSVVFVMSVCTATLGSRLFVFSDFLTPYTLALPLVLLSIYYGINNRHPILIGLLCGIASLVHPPFGLGSGAVILLSLSILNISQKRKSFSNYIPIIFGYFIMIIFASLTIIPYFNSLSHTGSMATREFVRLAAYFRNPHHYLPSYILTRRLITIPEAISFFSASGIAWYWWKRSSKTIKKQANFIVIFTSIIFLTCIGGYIFVELIPSRLWMIAQPFRFLNLLKWLGLILIAGSISNFISNPKEKFYGYLLWVSILTPITAFIGFVSKPLQNLTKKYFPFISKYFEEGPILIISVSVLSLLIYFDKITIFPSLFFISSFIGLSLLYKQRKFFYILSSLILIIILANTFLLPEIGLPSKIDSKLAMHFRPKFTLSDYSGDNIEIGKFVKKNTPEDSIFLTPPDFGELRITGKRAIVVDFTNGLCTKEWEKRLFDCYGSVNTLGFNALNTMDENFKNITDEKILSIKEKYNISYAILYKETKTHYPILYKNNTYKLIYLCK